MREKLVDCCTIFTTITMSITITIIIAIIIMSMFLVILYIVFFFLPLLLLSGLNRLLSPASEFVRLLFFLSESELDQSVIIIILEANF